MRRLDRVVFLATSYLMAYLHGLLICVALGHGDAVSGGGAEVSGSAARHELAAGVQVGLSAHGRGRIQARGGQAVSCPVSWPH